MRIRGTGGNLGVAMGVSLVLGMVGCAEEEEGDPLPTLEVEGFEVPTLPTHEALLDLAWYLPSPYLPEGGQGMGMVVVLNGPEGLVALEGTDLTEAPELLPQGEEGQVGAFWLPPFGEEGSQDPLDGQDGYSTSFSLTFSATQEGQISMTVQLFDVNEAGERGQAVDELEILSLIFDGGDEEATVVE